MRRVVASPRCGLDLRHLSYLWTPDRLDAHRGQAVPRVFLFTTLAIFLGAASALAADPPPLITARLDYAAAQGCPPASMLRGEFARRLGHDPFVEDAPLRVVVTIEREHGALIGSLKLYDSEGRLLWTRPTHPRTDCQAIVREMAGALAVRLDPLVYPDLSPPPPKPAPEPPPPPKPAPEPPPPPKLIPEPPRPEPAAPTSWRAVVGIGPQIVIGAEPAFSLVGHLGLKRPVLSPGMAFSLGMEFRYDAPNSLAVEDLPGASVQTFFVGGSLVSCLHGKHLFGCAVVTGGALSIESTGFDNSSTVRVAWGFVGTGPRVGFEEELRPGLAIRVYGEGLVALRPLQGVLDGVKVREPALSFPVSGVAGASLLIYLGGPR